MNATTFALASERAVMSAAIVYALAVLAYLVEWARGRNLPAPAIASPLHAEAVVDAGPRDGRTGTLTQAVPPPPASPEGGDRSELAGRIGTSLMTVAVVFHLTALVTRGLAAQRVPWGNMYEFALAGTFGAAGLYLALIKPLKIRWLGLPVAAFTLVVLMIASLTLYVPAGPLVPALHSYWLMIHVTAAIVAVGGFTLGAITSLLYLVQERRERRDQGAVDNTRDGARRRRLPPAEVIDGVTYRIHAFAFPVWTFAALIAGPIWAKYAWGRYWGWDPKEVWAFITWVVYAAYLHSRATAGWRGRGAAAVALVGFATVIFNFVGINLFGSGLHSYSGF